MPLRINGDTSGYVQLNAPAIAGTTNLTLPLNGFGKVLQVVFGTSTTSTQVASTTYADTSLSATITPSSSSSKVLVLAQQHFYYSRDSFYQAAKLRLVRGSTTIYDMAPNGYESWRLWVQGVTVVELNGFAPVMYLDSPSTTSATTYKLQGACESTANNGQITFQRNGTQSNIILVEVGP